MVFMCKNVCAKPGEQGFFIGATEFADLRDRADLRSMGLNGPPLPGMLGKQISSPLFAAEADRARLQQRQPLPSNQHSA